MDKAHCKLWNLCIVHGEGKGCPKDCSWEEPSSFNNFIKKEQSFQSAGSGLLSSVKRLFLIYILIQTLEKYYIYYDQVLAMHLICKKYYCILSSEFFVRSMSWALLPLYGFNRLGQIPTSRVGQINAGDKKKYPVVRYCLFSKRFCVYVRWRREDPRDEQVEEGSVSLQNFSLHVRRLRKRVLVFDVH